MGISQNISRESYHITAGLWIVASLLGALPYLLSGMDISPTDAIFESVSGLTTTGSSVLADPGRLPTWLRLWRALTQWVGGLGLVLLIVALVPSLRSGGSHLYASEFSGTQQRKLHPHMAKNVSRMWFIYIMLTLTLAVLLAACGNPVDDALCLAMSTVSTGGFMTSAGGLAAYSNASLAVITVFMFLSGINVAMIYNFATLHWRRLRRSDEFVVYAVVFTASAVLCTAAFGLAGNDWWRSACYSVFHIASTLSTCGFVAAMPERWPFLVSVLTFLLIVSGAMAGSTGGGIKLRRLMTFSRYLHNYFTRMLHPGAVLTVRIDRQTVPSDYVNKIFGFVFLYILFIIGGAFALTLCGIGIADAFCVAAANISNLGPTPIVGAAGAGLYYTMLPTAAKWILMILMLAGRLEIFALLAILSPSYWKRR